ncbi:MAG: cadherin-like beta sandwich domain-containing protein [Clostridia bacterium]|nr:cadherin-like beta sandwich domain-containing protein [Clostridia bacterium]
MKKIIAIITAAALAAILTVFCMAEFKASFTISGPGSVRAGNTLTVSFKADGNGICGILADISYDTSSLTYKSSSDALSNWRVEVNEKGGKLQIWAEENNGFKSPVNSQKTIVSLSFKVSDKVSVGDKISIRADIAQVSDTENELSGLSASYSCTVARPLSADSSLKSLSVEGYTLKPEFSPRVTEYEIEGEVEYTLSALKVNAKANDGEASVEISGSRLSVGNNTVRVKVTAENGSDATTYTIKAKMKQDPNYVASSVATLMSVTVSEGRVSPAFSPDRYDYIVYVPYEVETVNISSVPADVKAKAETNGPDILDVGENLYIIKCTAEDGTVNEYRITVMRMNEYGAEPESESESEEEPETEPETETEEETETETEILTESETETEETETDDTSDTEPETEPEEGDLNVFTKPAPLWVVLAAAVGGIAVGALGSIFIYISLKERK